MLLNNCIYVFYTIKTLITKLSLFQVNLRVSLVTLVNLVMELILQLLILHHAVLALDIHIMMGALVKPVLVNTLFPIKAIF